MLIPTCVKFHPQMDMYEKHIETGWLLDHLQNNLQLIMLSLFVVFARDRVGGGGIKVSFRFTFPPLEKTGYFSPFRRLHVLNATFIIFCFSFFCSDKRVNEDYCLIFYSLQFIHEKDQQAIPKNDNNNQQKT